MASTASDFQKFITDARERKKNSALADRIFSRDRRSSAPPKLKPTPGGSLASRVGVKKRAAPDTRRRPSLPAGNVNSEWTHDLHHSLASRTTHARNGAVPKLTHRKSRLAIALDRTDPDQVTVASSPPDKGLTIRGLAGPFVVMGQNFAPGTTAADIESAMTPVGGEMVSCSIVKTHPFLIAEMVFMSREGGERVIEQFNDKTADGRIIKMFPKIGGYKPLAALRSDPPSNAPVGPKSSASRDQFIEVSTGFQDSVLDTRNGHSGSGRLYSDGMVGGSRRGRGHRGRGGR